MAPILPSRVVLTSKSSYANETHLVLAESTYYIHEVGSSSSVAHGGHFVDVQNLSSRSRSMTLEPAMIHRRHYCTTKTSE